MIYYNSNTINDWNFGDDNIIKVYRNNAVCYYKVTGGGDTPTAQTPCFAVVDDISQYQDTEFEDVFNKADGKWYKLNNLNQYEEYGVYGSGRTITTYEGKLTIDDGYEYEWNGSSWVNVGEVSGSSRVPIGYTEVEYIQNTGTTYLDIAFKPNTNTRILTEMQAVSSSNYPRLFGAGMWNSATGINLVYQTDGGSNCLHINWYGRTSWSYYTSFTFDYDKHTYDLNKNSLYRDETLVGSTSYTTSYQSTDNLGVFTYMSGGRPSQSGYWGQEHFKGKMYSFKVYDNGTLVRDLVPCKKDNDDTVGAYDIVNDVFYTVPTGYTTDKLIAGAETRTTEYPKYYSEQSDPPNNLVFSSMTEAEDYECPWVGMNATIDNTDYIFDVSYQWVTKYGLFEVSGEYICNNGDKYKKMEEKIRNVDDTWSSQNPPVYEKGELVESASTDCSTYTELTYIQLSDSSSRGGVQLLNTPKEGLLIEMDFEMIGTTSSGDMLLIGQKDGQETVSYQMGFMQYSSWSNCYYDYGGGRLSFGSCPSFTTRRTWKIGRISGSTSPSIVGYYCDGTVGTKSVSTLQFDANRPYIIGNIAYNGSSVPQINWNIKPMKLYSVKIYEDYGVTLVGDYIPVIKEDGTTVTLYDKVSGNYANPVGTIIAGDPV